MLLSFERYLSEKPETQSIPPSCTFLISPFFILTVKGSNAQTSLLVASMSDGDHLPPGVPALPASHWRYALGLCSHLQCCSQQGKWQRKIPPPKTSLVTLRIDSVPNQTETATTAPDRMPRSPTPQHQAMNNKNSYRKLLTVTRSTIPVLRRGLL